jgi:hypothetical protein
VWWFCYVQKSYFSWHLASFWFGLVILLSVWFGNILTVHGNVLLSLSLWFGLVILIFIWIGTVLKGPKHDQVEGEFFYIKQTRMVRRLRDRRKKFILFMIGADIRHFEFLAKAEHTLKIM